MTSNEYLMPQHVVLMRLRAAAKARGRPSRSSAAIQASGLSHTDIAKFFDVSISHVRNVACGKLPLTPKWQYQLSALFLAWDRGEYARRADGTLERITPPSEAKQPRATIDVSGAVPRVNWSR